MQFVTLTAFVFASITAASAFPHYARDAFASGGFKLVGAQPLPPPITDRSSKLVNDADHPYRAPGKNDMRGPCPGLNTLANHGYLPRSGVATPAQIINAVQEGFNMAYEVATFTVISSFVADGNHETNLLSIGGKTPLTGPDPPAPAVVGGLNVHGFIEVDASTTRSDAFLGDNSRFNATLFAQLVDSANKFGNGTINHYSMAEHRYNRIMDSMARNPHFTFSGPSFSAAYGESAFPLRFFVNGTKGYLKDGSMPSLDVESALGFMRDGRMPEGFWRREGAYEGGQIIDDINWIAARHPVSPGNNEGLGNYVPDNTPLTLCATYQALIGYTTEQYPTDQVKGGLREAVKGNIKTMYNALSAEERENCEELFPYGQ